MTLSNKLGKSYDQVRENIKIKPIPMTIGEASFTLRVRIPLKKEMESTLEAINNPPEEAVQAIYERLSKPILDILESGGDAIKESTKDKVIVKDDDVIMDGTSIRQAAKFTAMWETKVERFFQLLQSETDEPINETYAQITDEFPEQVVRTIVEEIEAAIKPDYKTAKKN